MKAKEFADALLRAADLFPSSEGADLRALADLFSVPEKATVAATLTKVRKAREFAPIAGQPSIGDMLVRIAPLVTFAGLYAKPTFAKDLQSATEFLQDFSQAGVRSFVDDAIGVLSYAPPPPPTAREEVVERHLRLLEETLGDDAAFTAAYKALDGDPAVGKLEIAAISKRFAGKSASSRPAALKKIWARHHALAGFKSKSESRDGRSAA